MRGGAQNVAGTRADHANVTMRAAANGEVDAFATQERRATTVAGHEGQAWHRI